MAGAAWRAGVIVAALTVAGCGGERAHVVMRATPALELPDVPARVTISGLPAHGAATLTARWRSIDGTWWASRQTVHGGADGRVVLRGVDGMRFIWAMRPERGHPPYFIPPQGTSAIRLALSQGDRVLARAALDRRDEASGVRTRTLTLRRDRLVGTYYTPAPRRGPGIAALLLGGSEGGTPTGDASYADHGHPALALCYFKCPGLPRKLDRIGLEYFARALRWLARQPGVDPRRIIVDGGSRGGEAALLIASTFRRLVHGAIASVPSYEVVGACCGRDVAADPAWTLRGRPVPLGEVIRVERISGPVLVESGGEDRVWDSSFYTQQIEQRLTEHHFRYRHARLDLPGAGHIASRPEWPSVDVSRFGGTPRGNALASQAFDRARVRYLRALAASRG